MSIIYYLKHIPLKHTLNPLLYPSSKNKETPENTVNTPFPRANTFIFLSADRRSPHAWSVEKDPPAEPFVLYSPFSLDMPDREQGLMAYRKRILFAWVSCVLWCQGLLPRSLFWAGRLLRRRLLFRSRIALERPFRPCRNGTRRLLFR